jgi:hypothetical protein
LIKVDAKKSIFRGTEDISSNRDEDRKNNFSIFPFDSPSFKHGSDLEKVDSLIPQYTEPEMIPRESTSEDDLIAYTKFLHTRLAISTVQCYWLIGKSILSFYKGKYGTGELQ